jgi:hypothetical protein
MASAQASEASPKAGLSVFTQSEILYCQHHKRAVREEAERVREKGLFAIPCYL